MNKVKIEKLLEFLGSIKLSDVEELINKYDLKLEALEIFDCISDLYSLIFSNC